MTWLSDRSGIASIGVVSRAQSPQPPRNKKPETTSKRFLSDSSMSRLITHTPPWHRERAEIRARRGTYRDSETNVRTLRGEERGLGRRRRGPEAKDDRPLVER